jgi:hypothetical protein
MPRQAILSSVLLACCLAVSADDERPRRGRAEQRKAEELRKLASRLKKLPRERTSAEQQFIQARAADLWKRAGAASAGSYLFGRLAAAADDLLDAGEELARRDRVDDDDDDDDERDRRRRTAQDLQRAYFRTTQADYFVRQSREADGPAYARTARRLYQLGRAAYDRGDYRRARRYADAVRNVIEALENLAQAAVPVPEPPVLREP